MEQSPNNAVKHNQQPNTPTTYLQLNQQQFSSRKEVLPLLSRTNAKEKPKQDWNVQMDRQHLKFLIIALAWRQITTYEISRNHDNELIYINDIQEVDLFCRYHTIQYEVELKGINEIQSKITISI